MKKIDFFKDESSSKNIRKLDGSGVAVK